MRIRLKFAWIGLWTIGLALASLAQSQSEPPSCKDPQILGPLIGKIPPRKTQLRVEAFVADKGRLPKRPEDISGYNWLLKLRNAPESQWPDNLTPQTRELIRAWKDQAVYTSVARQQRRVEAFVADHGRLMTRAENASAFLWLLKLKQGPQDKWPQSLSPRVRKLLRAWNPAEIPPPIAAPTPPPGKVLSSPSPKASLQLKPRERVEEFTAKHNRLMKKSEDPEAYAWLLKLKQSPEGDWPAAFSITVRELLRDWTPQELPQPYEKAAEFIDKHDRIMTKKEDSQTYRWLRKLKSRPESNWPAVLSPRTRELLRTWEPEPSDE